MIQFWSILNLLLLLIMFRSFFRIVIGRSWFDGCRQSGHVDLGEFLSFMLIAIQKVDKEDIDELKTLFHSLDKDKSGALNGDDLKSAWGSEGKSRYTRQNNRTKSGNASVDDVHI